MKSHMEEMKISIEMAKENNPMISIQITNPNDPLILYILNLSEIEYQNIMKAQKILVNFEDCPNFLKNLVELCSDSMNGNYSAKLEINNSPEVVFCIEEKIKFKITEHIRLKLKKATDEELKKYLSTIYLYLYFSQLLNFPNYFCIQILFLVKYFLNFHFLLLIYRFF